MKVTIDVESNITYNINICNDLLASYILTPISKMFLIDMLHILKSIEKEINCTVQICKDARISIYKCMRDNEDCKGQCGREV